jgi:hypothetical protein
MPTHAELARMRKISRWGSYSIWVSVILRVAWRYRQSLVQYGACAAPDSKRSTEDYYINLLFALL